MAKAVQLKVFLAGRVALETDGVEIDEGRFAGRQGRLLFAYLAAEQGRPVPRDELAEALWGEAPPATWDKALTVGVSKLRSLLTNLGMDGATALTGAFGCYRLELPEGSWVDVIVAPNATHEAEEALAAGDLDEAKAAASLAESLVRQPFLPGEEGAWVDEKRRELADVRSRALTTLADAYLRSGDAPEAVDWAEQAIALVPFRETGYRRLMEAHTAAGNRAEALQVYERCRRLLSEELGAYPSPETESIYRGLLAAPATAPMTATSEAQAEILDQDPELDVASVPPDALPVPRLPARSTSFVGRSREQREIRSLLGGADARLLTLTGPAGTGKTRLAVEATTGLDAEFPGGVVLVELAPISDADLVATAIAGALGLAERPGRGALEALVTSLRGRRALLVLDNFEQVLGAAPMLTELLTGAPALTILVTSRAPLDISEERIYPVPPLQLPDPSRPLAVDLLRRTEAVRLFVARARDVRPDFELSELNADAVAELCRRLDGLPLALELAAARIKLLSPRDILERLGVRLEVLKAEPGAGLPDRHRTLRAAIEWSYDLLGAEEQALFTSLGVFVGGFTLEGAKAIAGDLELDIVAGVESLLNNSLLRTEPMAGGEPRFGMLETIREYAVERTAERGDGEAVRRRHAGFYLPLAEEAEPALLGPNQLSWLKRLDAERDNLRAALTWATEEDEADVGLRIGAALWRYWQLRGSDSEGRERLERLLALRSGSEEARAKALSRTASLAFVKGDHEAVRRYGDASLPVLRQLGDDAELVYTLGLIGNSALALGDLDRARALTEEALEVGRRSGDLMTESYALYTAGVVFAWRGELDEAERLIEESVRGARQLGNVRSVASWTRSLGGIALARRDYAQARPLFEESLALHRTLDDTWGISHSLTSLALLLVEAHDDDAARSLVAESVALELKSGDRPGIVFNFEVCARLAAAEGRRERAVRLYACASALRGPVGTHPSGVGWPDPETHVAELRSALGEDAFAEAWAEGSAMSFDESLDYALGEDEL